MALTSLNQLKTHLGVSLDSSTLDDFLEQLLSAVEAAFAKLVDRRLERTAYVEYYSPKNSAVILLDEYPVLSVTEVRYDRSGAYGASADSFGDSTVLTAGVDYALVRDGRGGAAESGRLLRLPAGSVWPGQWRHQQGLLTPVMRPLPGALRVSYEAGYDPVPEDVQLCLWQVCAQMKDERARGRPLGQERFEDYMYSQAFVDALQLMQRPGSINSVVARWKRLNRRGEVLG